jgi:hypothetical protein
MLQRAVLHPICKRAAAAYAACRLLIAYTRTPYDDDDDPHTLLVLQPLR